MSVFSLFKKQVEAAKDKKRIVFPESDDLRILTAIANLKKDGIIEPILIGNPDEIAKLAKENNLDLAGVKIYDLNHYEPEVGNNEPGRIYKGKPWDSRVKASEGRGEIIGLDSEIGTGLQNTDKLIGKFSTDENLWYYVASHREVTSPAWFVPSVDELYQLKLQRKEIGNFTENHYETGIYWSSTEQISYPTSEGTSYAAYAHKFYDDAENFLGEYKSSARRIRLCRYSTEEELSKQTFLVTLSAENEEAVIHYTIDGSEPNSSSLVYEKPFRVPVGTTVKAISTLAGFANSEVAEGYAK